MGASESDESDDRKEESDNGRFSGFTEACKEAGKAAGIGVATEVGVKTVDYAWDKFNEKDD